MEMDDQSAVLNVKMMQEGDGIKVEPPEEVQTVDLCCDDSDLDEDYCFGDIYLCLNEATNTVDEVHERKIVKKNYRNTKSDSAVNPSFDINKFRFKCLICKKIFKNNNLLTEHMITHSTTVQTKFSCTYCKQVFYYEHYLIRHIKIQHSETSNQKELEAQFKVDDKPNTEEESPVNIKKIRLSLCEKINDAQEPHNEIENNTKGDTDLNKHEVSKSTTYTGNPTKQTGRNTDKSCLKCAICKMIFNRAKSLVQHLQTHNRTAKKRDKDFLCTYCNNKYYSNYHLNRHVQTVHFKRTFKCKFCAYTASRNYRVTAHMSTKYKNKME